MDKNKKELKKRQEEIIEGFPDLEDKFGKDGLEAIADLLGDDIDGLEAMLGDESLGY